jgi:hypothetical protein|tara:strand:+ start:577 stop:1026 length:450 start_codon:yes stop_codon:yes gene_type:complete
METNKYGMPFCGLSLKLYETGKKAPSMEYSASSTKSKFMCSLTKKLYGLSQVMDWYNTPEVQAYAKAGYSLKWGSKVQQAKESKFGADTEQVVTMFMVKPFNPSANVDGMKPIGQVMPTYKEQPMTQAAPFAPDHAIPAEELSDDEIPF